MKKIGLNVSAAVFSFLSCSAHAINLFCPPVGALYHGGAGTLWEVSQEFVNQGWFVSQNPEAINTSLSGTSYDNPLVATITNGNVGKTYYLSCVYKIGFAQNNVTVVLANRMPLRDPVSNAGFKRVEDGVFECDSTLSHPDKCRSDTLT